MRKSQISSFYELYIYIYIYILDNLNYKKNRIYLHEYERIKKPISINCYTHYTFKSNVIQLSCK